MRRALVPAVLIAVMLGTGCNTPGQPQGSSPTSHGAGEPTSTPPAEAGLTRCADIGAGTPPPDVEVNTVLDREGGRLTISFLDAATNDDRSFTIAYDVDPDCRNNPRLNELIQHALDAG